MYYKIGRKIILIGFFLKCITTALLFTDLQMSILLPANIFEHVLAVAFFVGIGFLLWGLLVKREHRNYKFSFWDIITILIIAIFFHDNWYTIVTPHPLFYDEYYI